MAIANVAHVSWSDQDVGTSADIDSTGANLLLVHIAWYPGLTAVPVVIDNKSNSWTKLTHIDVSSLLRSCWWYTVPSTVGSAHSVTVTGSDAYMAASFSAWSGAAVSPFDTENGGSATSASTVQPGSVTPSENNCLVVCGLAHDNNSSGATSIDGGFTKIDGVAWNGSTNEGGAVGYLIQTTAASANPTWNITSSSVRLASTIAVFKGPGGGTASGWGRLLSSQRNQLVQR